MKKSESKTLIKSQPLSNLMVVPKIKVELTKNDDELAGKAQQLLDESIIETDPNTNKTTVFYDADAVVQTLHCKRKPIANLMLEANEGEVKKQDGKYKIESSCLTGFIQERMEEPHNYTTLLRTQLVQEIMTEAGSITPDALSQCNEQKKLNSNGDGEL